MKSVDMKVTTTRTFTNTVFYIEYEGVEYIVTHREDADGFWIKEWTITDVDGENVFDKELHHKLFKFADKLIIDRINEE